MRKISLLFSMMLVCVVASFAQISIPDELFTYTQDFDGLANTGTPTWTDNSTITGWYSNRTTYLVSTGTATSGSLYSYGAASATDRALGSQASGTATPIFGIRLKNTNATDDITSLTISFTGEQWRRGDGMANTLSFSYQISASAITSVTSGTWTSVSSLNFTAPISIPPNNTALDGNLAANQELVSATIAVAVPPGSEIMLRWSDFNDTGSDDGISVDNFNISAVTLPITLLSFNAKVNTASTELTFSTATEKSNDRFEIERSNDGRTFEVIGKVKGAGDANEPQYYTFEDKAPKRGINYYRLRQVDFDGQSSFSPTRSVVFGTRGTVLLFPTPVADMMTVRIEEAFTQDAEWHVIDLSGRIVAQGTFAAEQLEQRIPVGQLAEGNYVLRMVSGQTTVTEKFRKTDR